MSARVSVYGNIAYQYGNKSTLIKDLNSYLIVQQQNRNLNYWSIRKTVDIHHLLLYRTGIFFAAVIHYGFHS